MNSCTALCFPMTRGPHTEELAFLSASRAFDRYIKSTFNAHMKHTFQLQLYNNVSS